MTVNTLFDTSKGDIRVSNLSSTGAASMAYNAITTGVTSNNIALTPANIFGGFDLTVADVQTVISAGCTLTLPSVAATVAYMVTQGISPSAGYAWELDIYNDQSGAFNFTLTADSGATWTLNGSAQTIAKGTMRKYMVSLTSLTAGVMQSLGGITLVAAP
jgi:hypothetical protein